MGSDKTSPPAAPGTSKPDADEIDNQFRALMEGLRTTIPGMMVFFAFLLTLPLQVRFASLSRVDRAAFYIAFFSSALSALLLISPSVHQRMRAPKTGIKRRTLAHVMIAVKLALAGTVFFLIAIVAVVYLVSVLVFTTAWAAVAATVGVAGFAIWAWFYIPLIEFEKPEEEGDGRR